MRACITSIESAFAQQGVGNTIPASTSGSLTKMGSFHLKSAGLLGEGIEPPIFVAKINANFPSNPSINGLPTIQGVIALFDATAGRLLALVDSIEITSMRTAAATAVAARHLARADSATITVCGCGEQGRSQLRALACEFRIRHVLAFDIESEIAERYAGDMAAELDLEITPVRELGVETRQADIWVTGTTSQRWFVGRDHIAPGTFIAAVGADNPRKQEIAPDLLAASTVVVDVLEQCATMGDLHHALSLGLMTRDDVHAELADIVVGRRPGRRTREEVIVFDSTGTALEDVAATKLVYDRAVAAGVGMEIDLASVMPNALTEHRHV